MISKAMISKAMISKAMISKAMISEAMISEAMISEAMISEAMISEAMISDAMISEAMISEAMISKASRFILPSLLDLSFHLSGDDTVMFYHPLFREWLIRRKDNETTKFLCDPRNGHLAIALNYSRCPSELNTDKILDLCHHMLKAHVYRNHQNAKDLQSVWLSQVTIQDQLLSQALGSTRNIYAPNVNVARLLLLAGASPHYVGGLMQNAPLLAIFAHEGTEEMVALLAEFGADVNCRNADGATPLMFACQKGRDEVARTLVQSGATVNAIDNGDKSALVYAAEHGHLDIVELLVACDWQVQSNELGLVEAAQQATVMAASKSNIQVIIIYY
jgi:hypothetical protein